MEFSCKIDYSPVSSFDGFNITEKKSRFFMATI